MGSTSIVPTPPDPRSPTNEKLSREALERVLARAAEMQAAAGEGDDATTPEALSETQVLEVGQEVGIASIYLRQALAEERTRVAVQREKGFVARVAGATTAAATRTIEVPADQILPALNAVMLGDENLALKRRYTDRTTWEPRRDLWAVFRRVANMGGHTFELMRAREVGATITPLDSTRTLVRLDADVSNTRAQRLQGGGLVAGIGVFTGALIVGMGILMREFLPAALICGGFLALLGIGGGTVVARSHRLTLNRVQLALEQILDRLEHGDVPRALK